MIFNSVIEWLKFVEAASIEDLSGIINEDFPLEEYLASNETYNIKEETILYIREKLKKTDIEPLFWEKTLMFIDPKTLSADLIEYLINNDIALGTLGHLDLQDDFLWRLSEVIDEAVLTLGKRYYTDDEYLNKDFERFLKKFQSNYWLWNTLLCITPVSDEKRKILTRLIFTITDFEDLKRSIIEEYKAKVLLKTNKLNIIERYYETQNPKFLKSIAQNPNTTENILNELIGIKNIKNASQIRKLAEINLKKD